MNKLKLLIRSCNHSSRRIPGLWIILALCISLFGLLLSVQCAAAGQKTDITHESASADSSKQSGSDGGADQVKPKKITCLSIIREDYQGKKLSYPSKLFVDSVMKEIYVTDSGHGRILVYTHDFYPLLCKKDIFFEGVEGPNSFNPKNIAISKTGRLYVAGNNFCGVVVLNKDGTFSHLLTPVDSLGKGEEQKATICDVEIDSSGRIYLLSEDMGRIYVYDDKENFLSKFGTKGGSSGKLSRPRGLAVDDLNKRIYVIDYMRHTANAYSEDGRFLFEFGGRGWGKGWFQYPCDIVVDTSGNVLIADTFNLRVQVLKIEEL